jgi:hypothetical protein
MTDPIVDEVRRARDDHAARFNYDLDAIFQDIKKQERKSGCKFVSFPVKKVEPRHTLQPTGAAAPLAHSSEPAKAARDVG